MSIPEAGIQSFVDSQMDWEHKEAAKALFNTTVPGPETEVLSRKAKEYGTYICGQLRALEPEISDELYFNIGFVIDPKGEIIMKHHKLQVFAPERSCVPHDIWDKWVEKYGANLDAFYPIARTEIGNIGACICMETSYPETSRGLAVNGAEIIYAPTYIEPYYSRGWHELQLRARALDNSCYVVAPNSGDWFMTPESKVPTAIHGGNSMIVDYQGQVLTRTTTHGTSYCSAIIDIEALRYWRETTMFGSWLKDLRTEQYKIIYEEPIFPKNLWLDPPPGYGKTAGRMDVLRKSVETLMKRGTYVPSLYAELRKEKEEKEKKEKKGARAEPVAAGETEK
jgi:predicted amidohydrolase